MEFGPDEDTGKEAHGCEGGVEFLVASGEAAKGFEASKEVFDLVAFAIEMLVKRGHNCAICLRRDHRTTTELPTKNA